MSINLHHLLIHFSAETFPAFESICQKAKRAQTAFFTGFVVGAFSLAFSSISGSGVNDNGFVLWVFYAVVNIGIHKQLPIVLMG